MTRQQRSGWCNSAHKALAKGYDWTLTRRGEDVRDFRAQHCYGSLLKSPPKYVFLSNSPKKMWFFFLLLHLVELSCSVVQSAAGWVQLCQLQDKARLWWKISKNTLFGLSKGAQRDNCKSYHQLKRLLNASKSKDYWRHRSKFSSHQRSLSSGELLQCFTAAAIPRVLSVKPNFKMT